MGRLAVAGRKLDEANRRLALANRVLQRQDEVANTPSPFKTKENRRFKVP